MKRTSIALAWVLFFVTPALADSAVRLYIDSAPNPANAALYDAWQASAFSAAVDGSFVNMANGAFPGSTNFAATDAIVTATGGKQLSWVFFIPDESYQSLVVDNGIRFQIRSFYDWNHVMTDKLGWGQVNIEDVELNGQIIGVIGTFGDAFTPMPPDYPDVASLASGMYTWQTYWTGELQIRSSDAVDWSDPSVSTFSLTANLVPVPMAAPAGLALMALVAFARCTRKN